MQYRFVSKLKDLANFHLDKRVVRVLVGLINAPAEMEKKGTNYSYYYSGYLW